MIRHLRIHACKFVRVDHHYAVGIVERLVGVLVDGFDAQYNGERVPFQVGFHFTLMNGGAYWRALERFANEVCSKPDVACVSYRDYLKRAQPRLPTGTADPAVAG